MKNLKQTFKVILTLGVFSLLMVSCLDDPQTGAPPTDVKQPDNIIPIRQAKEMYDEYSEKKVPLLSQIEPKDGSKFHPTRYIEYTLEDLKHYIDYIESESEKAKVDISGVRIYLGAYPDEDKFNSGGKIKYPNQESILITPIAKNDGEDMAYFTRSDKVGGDRYPVFTKGLGEELLTVNGYRTRKMNEGSMLPFLTVQDTTEDRSLTMNRGFVVPPPKNDDDFNTKN